MFTFGFSKDVNEDSDDLKEAKDDLKWTVSKELQISYKDLQPISSTIKMCSTMDIGGCCLKLFPSNEVILDEKNTCISEAESLHSDLIPARYEGGLKVWECTEDLANFLWKADQIENMKGKDVLDLGCGAGLLGILALQHGANSVHFQDYNEEVLQSLTSKNIMLNCDESVKEKCQYFYGDWSSFANLKSNSSSKYDIIFTSETIYNPDSHKKLIEVFKKKLNDSGLIYLSAKTYYFGVGGGVRQFEQILEKDSTFKSEVVWKCSEGVQREILKITRRK